MSENLIVPRGKLRRLLSSASFDKDDFLRELARGRASDERLILSNESLSGSFWNTSDVETVATNLASSFPKARVIIILREQMSYLRSVYAFCVTKGRHMPRFGRFVEDNLDDLTRRLAYDRLVEIYHERFSRTNVLVIPYEKLSSDPSGFLNDIKRFCAMELVHDAPKVRMNASIQDTKVLETIRRINRVTHPLVDFENGVKALFDTRNRSLRRQWEHVSVQALVNRVAESFPQREEHRFLIPDAVESILVGAIRESNHRAASLLDWSPSAYGYLV